MRRGDDAKSIVSRHIKLLHEYNEAKDATQVCAWRNILSVADLRLQDIDREGILTLSEMKSNLTCCASWR